jgi:hypothetical protein
VAGYRPRPYFDTYNGEYDRYGRYGRDGRYDRYYDEYDRYGRYDRAYGRYDRYGPRYGAVNREGYGAIGATPGSWARNAQDRAMYRRHERYSHPAYEASRVRRMGINAPAGYSATIRDAQHRRWSRDREYELYANDGFADYDFEGPYEFDGRMRMEEDAYERGAYERGVRDTIEERGMIYPGRYGGREYDRELVD